MERIYVDIFGIVYVFMGGGLFVLCSLNDINYFNLFIYCFCFLD